MEIDNEKKELMGIPPEELGELLVALGHKKFRGKQISKWLYSNSIHDPEKMTDIPRTLRTWLKENCRITLPEIIEVARSDDGATKFLMQLEDNELTETVYIPDLENDRNTACISTQVGCRFKCAFCATGTLDFHRNLSSTEIIGQLYLTRDYIRESGVELTNIVIMGMGEPLDNLEQVIRALKVMLSDTGFGIGHRRVLISTIGIPDGIKTLMQTGLKPKLAISLNAADDKLRTKLMPINKRYPIASWINLTDEYAKYSHRWVTFEYVMIENVNDSLIHADQVVKLIKGRPAKVNLINLNTVDGLPFKPTSKKNMLRFQSYLLSNSIVATIRKSKGQDVSGACGQLAAKSVMK